MSFFKEKRYYHLLDSKLFVILMIFPLLPPQIFYFFAITDNIMMVYKIIAALIIGFLYLSKVIDEKKISPFMGLIFLFFMWNLFTTVVNSGSLYRWMKHAAHTITICMLGEMVIRNNWRILVTSLSILLGIETIINFLSYLAFPQGLYIHTPTASPQITEWFIGNDNAFSIILLPAALFALWDYLDNPDIKHGIWALGMYLLITVQFYLIQSATTTVCWFLFTVLLVAVLFIPSGKLSKLINGITFPISYCAIFVGIVILRLQYLIAPIITDVLHKNINISQRTFMWDAEMLYIGQSPWIGHGYPAPTKGFFYQPPTSKYHFTSHNFILNIVSYGGIVAILIFGGILAISWYKLYQRRRHIIAYLIGAMVWVILIMMIAENNMGSNGIFYILLCLGFYVSSIVNEDEDVSTSLLSKIRSGAKIL